MGRHVEAISYQRDGAEPQSASNLGSHHHRANCNDRPRPSFILPVSLTEENMGMAELLDGLCVHGRYQIMNANGVNVGEFFLHEFVARVARQWLLIVSLKHF